MDILLLSKVTLTTCNIILYNCPASLILLTSQLRVSSGWQYNSWPLSHAEVGGCTDDSWVLHSASRWDMMVIPVLPSPQIIPPGNVRCAVCSTVYRGQPSPPPSSSDTSLLDTLYSLAGSPPSFILPSVFSTLGWYKPRLSSNEILLLWDYPPLILEN